MLTDALIWKYFEFRGAINHTIEVYCNLCNRVIQELHEDSDQDEFSITRQHWEEFHDTVMGLS